VQLLRAAHLLLFPCALICFLQALTLLEELRNTNVKMRDNDINEANAGVEDGDLTEAERDAKIATVNAKFESAIADINVRIAEAHAIAERSLLKLVPKVSSRPACVGSRGTKASTRIHARHADSQLSRMCVRVRPTVFTSSLGCRLPLVRPDRGHVLLRRAHVDRLYRHDEGE
jgi:hypothetical protein